MSITYLDSTLAGVCSLVTDGTHDTPKSVKNGFPLIKAKEIVGGQIDFATCEQISSGDHLKVISRSKPEHGDTLFAHIGASLGEAAFVNTRREFSIKNVALFKPNPRVIDGRYLNYCVLSPDFQDRIKAMRTGSAQPFLGLAQLRGFPIRIHRDIETQHRIAAILSAYDDLIENNTRRIAVLEEMSRRLYEEWFVRFRFPGHEQVRMVESELGLIPEGWEVGQFQDIVKLLSGYAFKTSVFDPNGAYGLVTIRNVQDGEFVSDCTSRIAEPPSNVPAYCWLKTGDILLSLTGNVGRCCFVVGDTYLLNQRVSKVQANFDIDKAFSYSLFRSEDTQRRLEAIATGVAQKNLSPVDTGKLPLVIPPVKIREMYSEYVSSAFQLAICLKRKNTNLRAQRDLLLPKLISGEIDVSAFAEPEAAAA